jgi:adenine-specific DNA-methyltransferase
MKKFEQGEPETKSQDNKESNLRILKELFPEAFSEGCLDPKILVELLPNGSVDDREEKYGLNWHGKRQARQIALSPSTGTLRPAPEESANWDTTQNILIEGDNLEVLKLLQKSYSGKVKLIYIDPPYNTGKDFVYPDDFRDSIANYQQLMGWRDETGSKTSSLARNSEASGRFHTNWLNMMLPRLKICRSLLKRDGVILLSIDDHEIHNLRLVCDEVFGSENFIASFVWEKSRKNDAKLVSAGHEYVVVYANSLGFLNEAKIKWREEKPGAREIWNEYLRLREIHGDDDFAVETALQKWFSDLPRTHPSKKWSRYKHVDKHGPWRDDNISWPGGGGPRYDVIHPKTGKPCSVPERGWVFSTLETMERMISIGVIEFRDDHTNPPMRKSHIRPIDFETGSIFEEADDTEADFDDIDSQDEEELATQVRGTYFYKQSQVTAKYMRSLMGAKVFDNPKDHVELARLIEYATASDPNALVLDFFAGSGSTGHSIWELNLKDTGERRFILVQIPEPLDPSNKGEKSAARFCDKIGRPRNIAELTKERLRRAQKKILEENTSSSIDLGFRVFKLDSSNIRSWDLENGNIKEQLLDAIDHVKPDRTESDVLYELLIKLGLDLCVPSEQKTIAGKTIHNIGAGALIACFESTISSNDAEPLALGIVALHETLRPAVKPIIVFRDSAFEDDVTKTNVTAILQQHGLENVRSL